MTPKAKKLDELARELLKVQRDVYHDRLKHELLNREVTRINNEGKSVGLAPNEILQECVKNQARYEKELEAAFKVPYKFVGDRKPATEGK